MSADVVKIATGGVKKGKNQGLKVVTANDLFTGAVIYWSKGDLWTEDLSDALAVEGSDALTALEKAFADEKAAVGPYLMDVEPDLSPSGRGRLRETIRDRGPTIHPEFGRQAEER
ncbi:DUF2849 domain-containing protein [Parvularcula sp. ZS-1/3]|uniref:DUF2849 domain-containing protein n=1 Tax=Parvularcula mediterranea TaxID=2732508 RepID=A0A7Y3RKK7_9PROT|nr:DUF2849 domain-containing protein [Parvularcula mediterranea]NNU15769.1 DUF2849 domain-containing protein [Parvularcula mediterranea]